MNNIDTDFYSRQIGTFGLDTIENLMKMKILIIGLRGLGMEIAKNIILSGPKEVSLFDKNLISHFDLGSCFYFSENQINNIKRDEGCLDKLSQLNPYVNVNILNNDILSSIEKYNVIVITELMKNVLLDKINEKCRNNNIGLIYGCVLGLISFIFVDFGNKFIIKNKDGKSPKMFYITNISNVKKGLVTIDPESIQSTSLNDGDNIKFKEIEGMNELNNKIVKVKIKSIKEFYINEDTSNYNKYIKGGIIEEVKLPIIKNYGKFIDNLNEPKCEEDFYDDERNTLRHSIIFGIIKYFNEFEKLPELNNEEKSQKILEYSKKYFEEKKINNEWYKETEQNFDENMVLNISKWSKAELSPICSFIGGIMTQEIIKFTGKYTPLEQWAWFDFYDTIKDLNINDRNLNNSRYDEQIAIYGNNLQNKLSNLNLFMIGAGALGCEYLKIFSMMGISTNKNSKVIITDNDNIEISNLNRQFLFRKEHTGKSKSECACKAIKEMNKEFNCEYQINLVNYETENIYNEEFWKKQNFIITAVDNVSARKYIDSQCTLFNLNLIDSGTEGIKASSQLIIPNISKSYNETHSGDLKKEIPMCTLRQFPSTIEHCIEWGKDKFDEYFIQDINFIKQFISKPNDNLQNILKEIDDIKFEKLKNIKILLNIIISREISEIIKNAILIFNSNYNYNIQNIIDLYPENYKNQDGNLFWTGAKRFPMILKFNNKDSLIIEFISSYTKIFCNILNISYTEKEIINNIDKLSNYKNEMNENIETLEKEINELINKIKEENKKFKPEKFEKDNDKNNHINFIYACSNLRARNYKLEKFDKIKTKLISGKIIPAVSTATACITGFSSTQIYTLLYNNNINNLKEISINLSVNAYFISKPQKVYQNIDFQGRNKMIIVIPPKFTIWDHINIKGPIKIIDFINFIKEKYNVIVKGIYTHNKLPLITNQDMLNYNIEDAYANVLKKNINQLRRTLSFTIDGKNSTKNNVFMPVFIYRF